MKINNLLKMFVGALMMTFIISSCADDFTEEDLLQAQYDLQQQQQDRADSREDSLRAQTVEALNQAGRLLDFSVTVVTDESPVEGVTISATNQSGETASATTDASGNITFADISMGGHTIKMTSADHVDLSFEIDFGSPTQGIHYEVVEGQVVAIETSESATITAIPLSGMLTSTVKGRVTFESDVTNNSPEIPQDVVLRANFATSSAVVNSTTGNITPRITQANIGTAAVDNTSGEYTMTLPSVPGLGLTYAFVIPTIETDATVAYSSTDNGQTTVEGGVAIGTFPAVFGPNAGGSAAVYGNAYSNLRAVYSEPAPEGAGFTVDVLGAFGRGLSTGTFDFPVATADNMRVRLTQGVGYQSSPVATIAGGGNTAAEDSATASVGMEWRNSGAISVNNGGEGYVVGNTVTVRVRRIDGDGNPTNLTGVVTTQGEVTAVDGDGAITAIDFDDLPTTGAFWDTWLDLNIDDVASIRGIDQSVFGTTKATFTLTYGGRINDIDFTALGEGYESIPTITLTGGGASTAATVVIEEMGFQYQWAPNSEVVTPYVLLPEAITFSGSDVDGDFISNEDTGYTNGTLGNYTYDNITPGANTVQYHLKVNADGTIGVDADDFPTLAAGVTNSFFTDAPEVLVENAKHEQAFVPVNINSDGEFTGLDVANGTLGSGYNERVTLTLQNLDGSAASDVTFSLTGFSPVDDTQEVSWNGDIIVTSGGSGFDSNINANPSLVGESIPAIGNLENGNTVIRNIDYGTGGLLDSRVQ